MLIEKLNKQNYKKIIANLRADNFHNDPELGMSVRKIVDDVRKNGDKALFKYTKRFDKFELSKNNIKVSKKEISDAEKRLSSRIKSDLRKATARVKSLTTNILP